MTIATGIAKQLKYKVESTWGTAPSASGSQLLRRTSSDLSLKKTSFESNELNSHYQRVDFRHGVRSVEGSIAGELSALTYADFMAAAVRRAWTAVSAISSLSLTIAGSDPYTITRGSGSWLTDGIKVGQIVQITAGAFNAANTNKNLHVIAVTASVITCTPLNGVALVAEGPVASATLSIPGGVTYAPLTGHTDLSYSLEHWFADIVQSEVYTGCKVNQLDISLAPNALATISVALMGKDVTTAASEYFTSPTAETTTKIMAAVNGVLIAQGGQVALVTGLSLSIAGNMTAEAVVGSNTYPGIAEGRILVTGSLSALFSDATLRDYFINETEVALSVALAGSNDAAAEALSFTLPRIKLGAADRDDGDKSLVMTMPFTALLDTSGGAGTDSEETTIYIQDSEVSP